MSSACTGYSIKSFEDLARLPSNVYYFVGGPKDKECTALETDLPVIEIPKLTRLAYEVTIAPGPVEDLTIEYVQYFHKDIGWQPPGPGLFWSVSIYVCQDYLNYFRGAYTHLLGEWIRLD